ncbi:hypothetical protein B0J18DRAFT_255840 [Chaetomium sp. MPI-SDFR-AT-0129]|nr:hypothetical protein B0J18DRAFT_255840 [Chaetomium sp. MPI-SDFR-AT-0129]
MPLPQPKTALNNACSVIFDHTLYTYSADAFQSLRLEKGAKWKTLSQGEKVTGGVCVGSTTGTAATSALFVVGGVSQTDGYQGLQKYTYSTGQWETIQLTDKVIHQRVGHGAIYLNSTDSILIYAGNQDGTDGPSTTTFTIGASAPYTVQSYDISGPPSIKPIILPWSAGEAALVGGSTWNKQVTLFNVAERQWVDSGASLAEPFTKDTSAMQAVLMTGDDGSKNLITFDMSVAPNEVKRTVLFTGPGVPVTSASPVRRRISRRQEAVRDLEVTRRAVVPLTVNDWPAYNSSLAPKVTRTNFALAQGADGTVVMAGGADDDNVLCMFNARDNGWVNAESKLFKAKAVSTESSTKSSTRTKSKTRSSTSTSSSASTKSHSATSTSASVTTTSSETGTPTSTAGALPASSEDSGPGLNTILGAALGGFFGLAILLFLIYVCIKRRRRKHGHEEAGPGARSTATTLNEKEILGLSDDTLMFSHRPPAGAFRGHQPTDSQSSFSSMAILMGRAGQRKSTSAGPGRKSSNESRRDSSDSTFAAFKSSIGKPVLQPTPAVAPARTLPSRQQNQDEKSMSVIKETAITPKPRNLPRTTDAQGTTRRSSGWNRYWSGGSALNLLGFGSGNGGSANNNNNNNHNANTHHNGPPANANNSNNNNNNNPYARHTTLGYNSERSSDYSNTHRMTQDSATVPALLPPTTRSTPSRPSLTASTSINEPRLSFNRVNAQSPTISVYQHNGLLKEGLSGQIETPQRPASMVSDMSASAYSSGIPESVQDAWDPTAAAAAGAGAGVGAGRNRPWGSGPDRSNDSLGGTYLTTPLSPASQSQGVKGSSSTSSGLATRLQTQPPRRQDRSPVRDDMSWLNLGGSSRT